MQHAHNLSYRRLPLSGAQVVPPPTGQQPPAAPPAGGIPVEQFRNPNAAPPAQQAPAVYPEMPPQPVTPAVPANNTQAQAQPAAQHLSHDQKKQHARKELKRAIGHANEILASAHTVFPFTLFPDTITIDRGKLTISHKFFFKVAEVTSLRIEDILNAAANVGPVFGSLKISTRYFSSDKVYHVNYLRRRDAIKIKCILQGYIIALRKKIDCSVLSTEELSRLLSELGSDAPEEK